VSFTPANWSFAAKTVAVDVTRLPTVTDSGDYRFRIVVEANPAFVGTAVKVEFIDGAWSFVDPAGPLMTQNLGEAPRASYVDIAFPTPPAGLVIDPASVTDTTDTEFTLSGPAIASNSLTSDAPVYRGGTRVRRS